MRGLATIALFAFAGYRAFAQPNDSGGAFEAVSIKPFPEGTPIQFSGCQGDPVRINCVYVTLKTLLMRAYEMKGQEIFGPGWIETEHFNIVAKVPQGATKEEVAAMFRNLLTERFKVVLHREKRLLPVYSLTVAKGGLKIKESGPPPPDDAAPAGPPPTGEDGFPILRPALFAGGPIILYRQGRARLQAGNTGLTRLAEAFTSQLDRVVVDETGLSGKYDIKLTWTPDASEPGGRPRQEADASLPEPDLFVAVEQQLGLKIAQKKMEREALVIDRAEKVPTEN